MAPVPATASDREAIAGAAWQVDSIFEHRICEHLLVYTIYHIYVYVSNICTVCGVVNRLRTRATHTKAYRACAGFGSRLVDGSFCVYERGACSCLVDAAAAAVGRFCPSNMI